MKKILFLMATALFLTGCAPSDEVPSDGRESGKVLMASEGEVLENAFFSYKVLSTREAEIEGRSPDEGNVFIAVEVEITNISDKDIPMGADFDLAWEVKDDVDDGTENSMDESANGDTADGTDDASEGGTEDGAEDATEGDTEDGAEGAANGDTEDGAEDAANGDTANQSTLPEGMEKIQQMAKTLDTQLADSYIIAPTESVAGELVFEVPITDQYWLVYEELWTDDFVGNIYMIPLSVEVAE